MKQISNLSSLLTTHGKTGCRCPICGIHFERYTCKLARVSNPTCSRACAAIARRVRVHTKCTICNADMDQTPSNAARVVTCSKACSSIRRVKGENPSPRNSAAYKKAARDIAGRQKCAACGIEHGPWVIRGLHFSYSQGVFDLDNDGELWCRTCHLAAILPLAVSARKRQTGPEGAQ